MEPLTCYKFNSSDTLDSDLISEWLSHFLTDFDESWEWSKILDLLISELHPDEENSLIEEEMFDDEDEDDFEDDFFVEQSHYKIDNQSEFSPLFRLFMRFLFHDINATNPSLNSEITRQETLTSRAVSEAVSFYSEKLDRNRISGVSAFPSITEIDDEYWPRLEKVDDYNLLKLEKLRLAKRDTEESVSIDTDMEDSMIPMLRSHVMKTFYERNETVLTDTIEKFLGRINPDVLSRYVSELKNVRHDLISKKVLDSPFLNFSDINVVSSKDLFIYVLAIKSPYVGNLFYSTDWSPMANIESNSEPEQVMDELDLLEDLLDVIQRSFAGLENEDVDGKFNSDNESDEDPYSLVYDRLLVESPALRFVVFSTLYFDEFNSEYTTYS